MENNWYLGYCYFSVGCFTCEMQMDP